MKRPWLSMYEPTFHIIKIYYNYSTEKNIVIHCNTISQTLRIEHAWNLPKASCASGMKLLQNICKTLSQFEHRDFSWLKVKRALFVIIQKSCTVAYTDVCLRVKESDAERCQQAFCHPICVELLNAFLGNMHEVWLTSATTSTAQRTINIISKALGIVWHHKTATCPLPGLLLGLHQKTKLSDMTRCQAPNS